MQKIWRVKQQDSELQKALSDALNIDPILARLLINREINTPQAAHHFLSADLTQIHDPFQFKNMDKVVARIKKAQLNKEKVLVFGDYDVDGVTSSVLLYYLLTEMGIEVTNHIPHRMQDGYGLNHEIGEFAKEKGISLLITVDCGITAIEEVQTINSMGIEVIIIDHHEPPDGKLPDAYAIMNPKQADCPYPFKELASVGLVAKLTQAIKGRVDEEALDFVSIGTIADVAPLRGENRIFVRAGLPKISTTKNKGLSALLEIAKIKGKKITPYYVGFILGPRINATGRMDSAHKSLDLFLSQNWDEAYSLAGVLEKYNVQRQKMQQTTVQEALDIVEQEVNFKDNKIIVLSKEGWHKGVLGIVASRITEKYYRPSVVISLTDGVGTASARSIDGFHLHDALSYCSQHLETFGGHQGAAGLRIKEENIDPFRLLINEMAEKTLELKKLIPMISIDCEIPLSSVNLDLANTMEELQPFGGGNPEPVFCSTRVIVKSAPVILGKETIKFWVTDGKFSISAVGFGMAKFKEMIRPGGKVDLAYQVTIDDWNKAPTAQLKLKDIRLSD